MKKAVSLLLMVCLCAIMSFPLASAKTYVALTFDDGPHKTLTPKLLDILKKYDAKATFFVVGKNAAKYPEIMERIVKEGHALGNHSYTHASLKKLSTSKIKEEVGDTQKLIDKAGYTGSKLLRPPYGDLNDTVRKWAKDNGYPIIWWSYSTSDYKLLDAKKVSDVVIKETKGGDFVLLHDIHATTVDAVEIILKKLTKEDYAFVTVPKLVSKYDHKMSDQAFWTNAR